MSESWFARLKRRAISIPLVLCGAVVSVALAPIGVPLLVLTDVVRGRFGCPRARAALYTSWLLVMDGLGALAAGGLWIRHGFRMKTPAAQVAHTRLQSWWAAKLYEGARRFLGLRFEIEGAGAFADGPALCIARHASFGDALLPVTLSLVEHGRPVRYVLTRELAWSPSLDLVGHRLPNHFVDRDPDNSQAELDAVARLAENLEHETIVVFPEGRFFTPARQARALERLADSDKPHLEQARALRHLLPPRPGGTLAILDARPDLDVIVLNHVGFVGLGTVAEVWRNVPLRAPVQVVARRIPATDIPRDSDGRIAWMHDLWTELDEWIDERTPAELGPRD